MEKLKSLLLPLALVFATLAVFEFGARYGATNMRAYAIASELQLPLAIYAQTDSNMDIGSKERFAALIDNGIAMGAMHREVWYLDKDARAALDKALTHAFSVRGDAAAERFASIEASDKLPELNKTKLSEIREAIVTAKVELVDNAQSSQEEASPKDTD
ncbi:hypothetical protein ACWPKO_03600 [Coraliomargarita sp. W4R53]